MHVLANKIVLASSNKGKLNEFNLLLHHAKINLLSQHTMNIAPPEETGLTFVENALIKARHAAQHSQMPALSDDSGIIVETLNNAPGVYSARYAGTHASATDNINKLLHVLRDIPDAQRTAYFVCTMIYLKYVNDPDPLICQGYWQGMIARAPQGTHGFGYDPIFYLPSLKCHASELTTTQKKPY